MKLKNIILIIALVFVAIIAGYFIMQFLSQGSLNIKTASDGDVYIVSTTTGQNEKKIGHGNTETRLKPGTYTIRVVANNRQAQILTTVTARQTTVVSIPLRDIQTARKILDSSAADMSVSGTVVNYRNQSDQNIYSYNWQKSDLPVRLNPLNTSIGSVSWASPIVGLAATADDKFLQYANGRMSEVILVDADESVDSVDTAQTYINQTGQIAFVSNDNVYFKANSQANNTQLAKVENGAAIIGLANDGKVVIGKGSVTVEGNNKQSSTDQKLTVVSGTTNNVVTTGKTDDWVSFMKWNNESNKLLIGTSKSLSVWDLQKNTNKTILNYPPPSGFLTAWRDNQNILYIDQGYLWQINLTSGLITKLAFVSSGDNIESLAVSADGKTAVFSTSPKGYFTGVGAIYSLAL